MSPQPLNLEPSREPSKLLIDKKELIDILQKLTDDYPSDTIPFAAVEASLAKFLGSYDSKSLIHHPAFEKLEQILMRAKSLSSF